MSARNSLVFGSGIPTEPDVKRLIDAVGLPEIGTVIPYAAVEKAIGSKRGEGRFQSVTMAWRKKMEREHNILVLTDAGVGFKFATPSERIHDSGARVKAGFRRVQRGATIANATPEEGLTDAEKKARAHILAITGAVLLAKSTAAKQIKFN